MKQKDIEPLIKQILRFRVRHLLTSHMGIKDSGLEIMSLQAMNVLNEVIPTVHDAYFREALVTLDLINHIFSWVFQNFLLCQIFSLSVSPPFPSLCQAVNMGVIKESYQGSCTLIYPWLCSTIELHSYHSKTFLKTDISLGCNKWLVS